MGSILLWSDLLNPEKQCPKGEAIYAMKANFKLIQVFFLLYHRNLEMYDFLFSICKSEVFSWPCIKSL